MFGAKRNQTQERRSAIELQDEIMRFEGRFSSRLTAAFRPFVDGSSSPVSLRATRDQLEFMSAALDIAVGSSPEVDLLDMVTLISLGRDAMERRWRDDAFGDDGVAVVRAFEASFDDITSIAHTLFSDEVESRLAYVIDEWKRENPALEGVASVRLSAYAELRDGSAASIAKEASGLFSVVRGAAQAADTAVLLGERALYASQRLPFLVRMHARIASKDLMTDVGRALSGLDIPLSGDDKRVVLEAIGNVRALIASTEKPLVSVAGILTSNELQPLVAESAALTGKLTDLLREVSRLLAISREADVAERGKALAVRAEQSMNRLLVNAFLACGGVAVIATMSWLVARVAYDRLATR